MEEKDKLENGSQGRSMSDADKEYYADLYNDLPKEVQDILMQTHPLMGRANEDTEAAAYRTRRPQREDVEEVKEARMQQVSSEINEIKRAPQQEGDPTRYVSRRARSMESEYAESPRGSMAEDDYNEDIQYVSVMPARKKSRIMEEVTIQTSAPQKSGMKKKKQKKEREEMPFSDMERSGDRPRYEDIDFEERAKQEHLDSLYGDGYDDDYRGGGRSKLPLILGIVGLVLIVFLIFKTVTLSSQLEEAQQKVTETQDLNEKYEQVQLKKCSCRKNWMLCKILMARQRRKIQRAMPMIPKRQQAIPHPAAIPILPAVPAAPAAVLQNIRYSREKHLGAWHRNSMATVRNIQRFWKQTACRKAKISSPVMY